MIKWTAQQLTIFWMELTGKTHQPFSPLELWAARTCASRNATRNLFVMPTVGTLLLIRTTNIVMAGDLAPLKRWRVSNVSIVGQDYVELLKMHKMIKYLKYDAGKIWNKKLFPQNYEICVFSFFVNFMSSECSMYYNITYLEAFELYFFLKSIKPP